MSECSFCHWWFEDEFYPLWEGPEDCLWAHLRPRSSSMSPLMVTEADNLHHPFHPCGTKWHTCVARGLWYCVAVQEKRAHFPNFFWPPQVEFVGDAYPSQKWQLERPAQDAASYSWKASWGILGVSWSGSLMEGREMLVQGQVSRRKVFQVDIWWLCLGFRKCTHHHCSYHIHVNISNPSFYYCCLFIIHECV